MPMNVFHRVVFCLAVAYIAPCVCCGDDSRSNLRSYLAGLADSIPMQTFLADIGKRLDCYFTVESVGRAGVHSNPMLHAMVKADPNAIQSIDGLVSFLTNRQWTAFASTNTISIVADRVGEKGRIIRLRDRRLLAVTDYALDRRVGVQHEGTTGELMERLAGMDAKVEMERVFSVGEGLINMGDETQVSVRCTNKPIREIITDCIPLSDYSRVIWSSYTSGEQESPSVTIRLHGERTPRSWRSSGGSP